MKLRLHIDLYWKWNFYFIKNIQQQMFMFSTERQRRKLCGATKAGDPRIQVSWRWYGAHAFGERAWLRSAWKGIVHHCWAVRLFLCDNHFIAVAQLCCDCWIHISTGITGKQLSLFQLSISQKDLMFFYNSFSKVPQHATYCSTHFS